MWGGGAIKGCPLIISTPLLLSTSGLPLASPLQFDYSPRTSIVMTVILGCAFFYFLVAQNRWSWHLIGGRAQNEMEVRPGVEGCRVEEAEWCYLPPPATARLTHHSHTCICALLLLLLLLLDSQEVLPQHPPAGLPWAWHRRPLGGPPAAFTRQSSLDKRSSELP